MFLIDLCIWHILSIEIIVSVYKIFLCYNFTLTVNLNWWEILKFASGMGEIQMLGYHDISKTSLTRFKKLIILAIESYS